MIGYVGTKTFLVNKIIRNNNRRILRTEAEI